MTLKVKRSVRYYDIEGRTLEDLCSQLRLHGPTVEGRRVFALTESSVRWTCSTAKLRRLIDPRRQATDLGVITVTNGILLPRWKAPADADAVVRKSWIELDQWLVVHEGHHEGAAVKAGVRARSQVLAERMHACPAPSFVTKKIEPTLERMRIVNRFVDLRAEKDRPANPLVLCVSEGPKAE